MPKKLTAEEFIKRSEKIHNNKYDYSKLEYKNARTKIEIICKEHGKFLQLPSSHLNGNGCKECSINYISKNNNYTTQEFIKKAIKIHGDKYDYSKVEYKNARTKIEIICPIHGSFWQIPYLHLQKHGCIKCKGEKLSKDNKLGKLKFIKKAIKIHGDKYDYSKIEYKNAHKKIKIICPIHGEFWQDSHSHLKGHGCASCNESKGEKTIKNYLLNNNIKYKVQKTFKNCKNKLPLRFDFYLPEYKMIIEYDGEQHFDKKNFYYVESIKINDEIKNEYCKNNNINLLRIPFWEKNNIKKILSVELLK